GSGGGVSCYDAFVEILNSILWGNYAGNGPQIAIGDPYETNNPTSTVMLYYSDIQGGEDDVFIGPALDPFTGPWLYLPFPGSVIDANPLFVSANQLGQTYYLSQVAAGQVLANPPNPCVDTGFGSASALASIVGFEPTTRTDHVADSGNVDMGYHYRVAPVLQYQLEIEVVNSGSGTNGRLYADWNVYGVDMNMWDPNTAAINPGTQVNLRAVPDENYLVSQWTGTDNDSTTSTRNTVTMYADTKVTVEFFYHAPTSIIVGDQGDFQTIVPAIKAAYDKDTIIIKPGTYAGPNNVDIDFEGKAITIRGEDPHDPAKVAATVINCAGTERINHRGFIFTSGEDGNSVLDGLTITNGFIAGAYGGNFIDPNGVVDPDGQDAFGDGFGGAVFIDNDSSPTIKNCVFRNCTVTGGYGGHGVNGGINTDGDGINGGAGGSGYGDGYGGAIYCDTGCSPTLISCTFQDNRASGGIGGSGGDGGSPGPGNGVESSGGNGGFGIGYGYGAAVYFHRNANPDINDCQFINNIVTGGVGGLGGKIGSGDPNTPRSTDGSIGFGFGTGAGGAIYYGEWCEPYVVDSTFNGNEAYDEYWGYLPIDLYESIYKDFETYYQGGGIHVEVDSEDVRIWNCDFTDNLGGGVYVVSDVDGVDVFDCSFMRNTSTLNGGGMYVGPDCVDVNFVECEFSANNCDSSGNLGEGGGGLNCKSDVMLDYCSFSANTTAGYGGAVSSYLDDNTELNQQIYNCSFVTNSSAIGGAVYLKNFGAEIFDCYILNNTAEHGGGMSLVDGSLDMDVGDVKNNTATAVNGDGGGLYCVTVSGSITNYVFCENSATSAGGAGGAVYLSSNTSPSIVNCLFADNLSKGNGGAIAVYSSVNADITNSTFTKSWADVFGGGIYCDWESSASIKDCIFDKCYKYAVYESRDTGTDVTYSLFNNNPHGAFYGFDDSGSPVDYNDTQIDGVSETDVDLNIGRTQEDELQLFVTGGTLGDYYLNQDAGQNPAIDGGSAVADTILVTPATNMGDYTTDIDNVLDGGTIVDIGYHYPDVETLADFEVTAQVYGGDGYVDIITPPNGSGRYYAGTVVTFKAMPRSGWRVRAWHGTDDDSSTATTNTVVVNLTDKHIGVEFEQAAILEVGPDGDYHTIQEAIYYAQDGDVVVVDTGNWILPGHGQSFGYMLNKSITIRSKYPDDPNWVAATVLDGSEYPGPILELGPDTDSGTIINGLTFQNSHWGIVPARDGDDPGTNGGDGGGAEGGAIYIYPGAG
ncbi:hypothetical protein DRJ17_07010, partial [Candidatus Woesearchaeota archaeon]